MIKAVYPGSFDPITIGHVDIIKRAASLVDELHVVVADNLTKKKTFTTQERIDMLKLVLKDIPNIVVSSTTDLVIRYAENNNIGILVRGLRNIQDYENEYALYQFNRNLNKEIETIILFPSSKNHFVSSSGIKELVYHHADISLYVPHEIIDLVETKFHKKDK
ncbi:Phosphopantetheine adenylyltransferase [Alteracholeplasma palmae J233]|uniref:Phosphopantetheine adenylyltransferase n=1 Tax=Alteracholeplasma palmae (strain ATCC 49389 / J233) TaxID=1318466 RepID=U4KP82_ALTPJ|nr:pantetheine-phosphate adenylyltransferase [Alteracholeplasma palmae]CCV64025.1 Phosphopantetheine adenylyltransferase [Alteracholeplasma palmae J233]